MVFCTSDRISDATGESASTAYRRALPTRSDRRMPAPSRRPSSRPTIVADHPSSRASSRTCRSTPGLLKKRRRISRLTRDSPNNALSTFTLTSVNANVYSDNPRLDAERPFPNYCVIAMLQEHPHALSVSVAEAAATLGVSGARVRALIKAGELDAVKIGAAWIVDPASVDRRQQSKSPTGRLFSPARALGLLMLAAGEPVPWLDRVTEWKLRQALDRIGFERLIPRMRKRATAYRFRAHPGDLKHLEQEPSVVRSGPSAASELRLQILAPGFLEAYVPTHELPGLSRRYHFISRSRLSNVILHVVSGPWPFVSGARVVPMPFAVVDLLESDEPRAYRAGRVALERLTRSRWRSDADP